MRSGNQEKGNVMEAIAKPVTLGSSIMAVIIGCDTGDAVVEVQQNSPNVTRFAQIRRGISHYADYTLR